MNLLLSEVNLVLNRDLARIVEAHARPLQLSQGFKSPFVSLCITHDCQYLYAGTENGWIIQYFLPTGAKGREFRAHVGAVTSIVLSQDEASLFTAGQDYMICQWCLSTGSRLSHVWMDYHCRFIKLVLAAKTQHLFALNCGTTQTELLKIPLINQRMVELQCRSIWQCYLTCSPTGLDVFLSDDEQKTSILDMDTLKWYVITTPLGDQTDFRTFKMLRSETMFCAPKDKFPTAAFSSMVLGRYQIPLDGVCECIGPHIVDSYLYYIMLYPEAKFLVRWVLGCTDFPDFIVPLIDWPDTLVDFWIAPNHQFVVASAKPDLYIHYLKHFYDTGI